jgi:hypothetical protein
MSDERCRVCGEDNPLVLEEHHLVPDRWGGSDSEENLVTLCANCHRAIEKIYDSDFWDRAAAAVRREREGPYISSFSEQEVCPECLRRFNPETETVGDREPQSPLYE